MPRPLRALVPVVAALVAAGGCSEDKTASLEPARLVADPAALHFGEVPLGSSAQRQVVLKNEGQSPLVLRSVRVVGGPEFSAPPDVVTLPAHETLEVNVRFRPRAAGLRSAVLEVVSNADNAPTFEVPLDGTGSEALVCDDCLEPPPSSCISDSDLLVYEKVGTCVEGECQYARRTVPCPAGCDAAAARCKDVACTSAGARRLTGDPGRNDWPQVAWNGREYGVAFVDNRAGNQQIFFTRVSAASEKLAPERAVTTAGESAYPALAWGEGAYGLAYTNNSTGRQEVYFVVLTEEGVPASEPVRVSATEFDANLAAVAWSPLTREFGVAWQDIGAAFDVYFARVSAAGQPVGAPTNVSREKGAWSAQTPALVWTGTEWGMAWSDSRDGRNHEIYFQLLSAQGVPQDPPVRVTNADGEKSTPALAWNGQRFGVTWTDSRSGMQTYFAELGPRGGRMGAEIDVSATTRLAVHPDIVWGRDAWFVVWADNRDDAPGTWMAKIPDREHPGAAQRIAPASFAYGPHASFGPGQLGVAWWDSMNSATGDIVFQTVCQ